MSGLGNNRTEQLGLWGSGVNHSVQELGLRVGIKYPDENTAQEPLPSSVLEVELGDVEEVSGTVIRRFSVRPELNADGKAFSDAKEPVVHVVFDDGHQLAVSELSGRKIAHEWHAEGIIRNNTLAALAIKSALLTTRFPRMHSTELRG